MSDKYSQLLRCPHCSNLTRHGRLFRHVAPLRAFSTKGEEVDAGLEEVIEIFECSTCHGVSLYAENDYANERILEWPDSDELHSAVPESVARHYREAKKVQNVSPSAFSVMIRRSLEALCQNRGVVRRSLHASLAALADSGELPRKLSEMSTVLREIGNAGAHHSGHEVTIPMTWAMDDFFRAVVEYVYVAPSKLAEFRERLKRSTDGDASEETSPRAK